MQKIKTAGSKIIANHLFNWRFLVGALFSLAALGWLITTTNWQAAWETLKRANYWFVLLAVLLNLLTIPMRTFRWRLLFRSANKPPIMQLTTAMLIGQNINVIVPARLGDLVRASLIKNESTAFVLGTQVMQTAPDLLMMTILIIIFLFQVTLPDWWRKPGIALLITAVIIMLTIIILVIIRHPLITFLETIPKRWPRLKIDRFLLMGSEFLRSLDSVKPVTLVFVISWSAAIWIVYGLTNYVLLAAFTDDASLMAAFFVLIVLQLSIAVPSSPGRIGVYHVLSVQALTIFAIHTSDAISFSIILHFISIILPIIIGGLLAWQMGLKLGINTDI